LEGIQAFYTYVQLATNQDVLMTSDTYAISLGDYADCTVNAIMLGEENLGTDVSALNLPETFKTDLTKHGEYLLSVFAEKDGAEVEIVVPVTFVTKAISSMTELNQAVTYTGTDNIYGYYVLTKDVFYTEEGFTVTQGATSWSSGNAFKGTFDGRGFAINTNTSKFTCGLFGTINGGTIKNVTFNDAWNNNACMIAYNAYNLTMNNVAININNGSENLGENGKRAIFGYAVGGVCSFTDVTITTKVKLKSVVADKYDYLTCKNVVVNGDVTSFWANSADVPAGVTMNANA
jgi:hypothetical protein